MYLDELLAMLVEQERREFAEHFTPEVRLQEAKAEGISWHGDRHGEIRYYYHIPRGPGKQAQTWHSTGWRVVFTAEENYDFETHRAKNLNPRLLQPDVEEVYACAIAKTAQDAQGYDPFSLIELCEVANPNLRYFDRQRRPCRNNVYCDRVTGFWGVQFDWNRFVSATKWQWANPEKVAK